MRLVIQRVDNASVIIDEKCVASIRKGLLIFVGIHADDAEKDREYLLNKLLKLRIFPDGNKNINKSVVDVKGEVLLVSQFTLYADCSKGNRPSFTAAMSPDKAEQFYNAFVEECKKVYPAAKSGIFGSMMKVQIVNNGPVAIILDSRDHL